MNGRLPTWTLAALFSVMYPAWPQSNSTSGDCSPIVGNVRDNVNITCSLLSNRIPIFKFSGLVSSRNIELFTKFVSAHEDDVIELDVVLNPGEEDQLYSAGPTSGEMLRLALNDFSGGATYTFNSGVNDVHGAYHIKGFFTIERSGEWSRSVEEVFLVQINKADLLTRGRVKRK